MKSHDRVLVGVGDDHNGWPELDWAAREAQGRGAGLDVVRAFDMSEVVDPWVASTGPTFLDDLRAEADEAVDAAVDHVRREWPEVDVRGRAVKGSPVDVLVEESREALLTVVGGRQLGPVGAVLLGSVSCAVVATATGPVVAVGRRSDEPADDASVVAGVDGSGLTDDVLEFAFGYAARRHRPLRAVTCWSHDLREVSPWPATHWAPEQADHWLRHALARWQEKFPEVVVHRDVVHARPVAGLVAAAAGQEVLVVGSHAKRAHVAALLGSVSQGVLHDARCPVAVVHPRARG